MFLINDTLQYSLIQEFITCGTSPQSSYQLKASIILPEIILANKEVEAPNLL